jgi:hypothetical protein
MELTLQPDEASLVKRILTNYLSDLRMEIGKTENYELRQELKRDEVTIKSLLTRLDAAGVTV